MRVIIDDDNDNWRKWGDLLLSWVDQTEKNRPTTTGGLQKMMQDKGIKGSVPGPDRKFELIDYSEEGTLYVGLPSAAMLREKLSTVTEGAYPLPLFYKVAFGGAAEVNLTREESLAFAVRRIGEYVVNQCC